MSAQDEQGRRLALIVASSGYRDPALQQLRAPGRDASDLAGVLRDPAIGAFDVRTLINAPSDQLLRGIAQFCHQAGPGDLVLVYLSCHGVLDDHGRLYYATVNTERALLSATAVSAQWVSDQLDDCRARRQILLLDCCHSGAFARGSKGDDALALKDRFSGRGKVVLTASRATEYSFEGAEVVGEGVRSVFTRAVVDGLRTGQADRDKDGLVTVDDLYHHVYDTVRTAEPRQTPEIWAFGAEGDLLVAHSPRGPVIEPAPLPEDVRLLIESSRPVVRESGVRVLAELLDHGEPGLALTARLALQRISEEDLPRIAALARVAHEARHGQAVTRLEAQEQARREAGQEARRQEAERAAAQREQRIEQLQCQMRDHAASQNWNAVLAVSNQLTALDPDAADLDGLATQARQRLQQRKVDVPSAEPTSATMSASTDQAQHPEPASSPAKAQIPGAEGVSRRADILTGHTGSVNSVAFGPDGRLLASCSDDKTVRLWDPATGEHRRTLTGHKGRFSGWLPGSVNSVAFSPDMRLLASCSDDKTVRLWDPATGEHRRTLTGHKGRFSVSGWLPGSVNSVAFSPDGRLLASCSDDNTVRLWDPASGEHRRILTGHKGWFSVLGCLSGLGSVLGVGLVQVLVLGVAFSPDGRLLASCSDDKTVRLRDPSTGEHRRTLTGHNKAVRCVAFSPDGGLLASCSDDKTVRLWDLTRFESG